MAKISLDICWYLNEKNKESIDSGLFRLLEAIQMAKSLRAASNKLEMSYRSAWGLIRYWNKLFGTPLVQMEKGRGAYLTEFGERLLLAERQIHNQFAQPLAAVATEVNAEFKKFQSHKKTPKKLRIYASHGLAIAEFYSLCKKIPESDIHFNFRGSLDSLRELAYQRCDVAGFHFPQGEISSNLVQLYNQWLDDKKHILIHVATRQQGIILNKNNPHKIKTLKDLTRRAVRFVNRQPESGTRTIFDELLKHEQIDKSNIRGYHDEEFTHVAVAALIASGAADAGFGIKAAASKFNLQFIPMITENYMLAVDKKVPDKILDKLKNILRSRQFISSVNKLPGYNVKHAGEMMTSNQVFYNTKTRR